MIDAYLFHAECIHAVTIALEAIIAAGLLTFLWMILPAIRSGGPRR
jgi:hypothetical protein